MRGNDHEYRRRCPTCGNGTSRSAYYCPSCGTQLRERGGT